MSRYLLKKAALIVFFLSFSGSLHAQFSLGVKSGVGMASGWQFTSSSSIKAVRIPDLTSNFQFILKKETKKNKEFYLSLGYEYLQNSYIVIREYTPTSEYIPPDANLCTNSTRKLHYFTINMGRYKSFENTNIIVQYGLSNKFTETWSRIVENNYMYHITLYAGVVLKPSKNIDLGIDFTHDIIPYLRKKYGFNAQFNYSVNVSCTYMIHFKQKQKSESN